MANLILTLISILLISFFMAKRFLSNQIHVDWSPTGEWIVFYCGLFTNSSSTSWSHLYIMRPDGSSLQQITGNGVIARSPTWSPDGKWIAFINGENEIVKVKPDATASETIFRAAYSDRIDDIDWSPTHNNLVLNISSYLHATSVLIFNVDDKTQKQIMFSDNHPARLKWSPDGELIVFANSGSSIENDGIYTISKEGGKPTQILDYVGLTGGFEWLNDGKELLLTLNKDQKPQLYRLDLATKTLQLVNLKHFWGSPNLSPNGDWIIFSGFSSEDVGIYKSRLDDTENQLLTEMNDCTPSSPQWIDFDTILAND